MRARALVHALTNARQFRARTRTCDSSACVCFIQFWFATFRKKEK